MVRQSYIDNASAILIIYMILGHAAPLYQMTMVVEPLSRVFVFFMAWFYFKSGMLRKERTVVDEFRVCSRTILIPFFFFSLLAVLIRMPFALIVDHGQLSQIAFVEMVRLFYSNGPMWDSPLWFLLTLFAVKILYSFLRQIGVKDLLIAGVSIVLAVISYYCFKGIPVDVGYMLDNTFCGDSKLPLIFGNLPLAMSFYTLGVLLREDQFNHWVVLVSLLVFSLHFFIPLSFDFRTNSCTGPYWFAFMVLLSGCICFNKACSFLFNRQIGILTEIGEQSLVYYVLHFPLLMLLVNIFPQHSGPLAFCLAMVCLFVLLFLSSKLLFTKHLRIIIGH